jgi:peptidoglycan hydrolase-like protein with peptidoglycan-binding domain
VTLVMFDAIDLNQIPGDAAIIGAYVGGRWPTARDVPSRFPRARMLTIAVNAGEDADTLDVEQGDATPADVPAWWDRQRKHGPARPVIYASASVMEAGIVPLIRSGRIPRGSVRLWSAHYTGSPHICGPSSCGLMSIAADGCQWTNRALGRDLDQSLLAADFFGTPPAPGWTETLVNNLPTLKQGDADKAGTVQFVHRLQALTKVIGDINKIPAASAVGATGTFDKTTQTGVLAIQKMFGLTQDGQCGPKTWAALVAGQHG